MVFLVSKETVVLRRWGRSKQKFEFIKRADKCQTTTAKDSESRRLERQPPVRANIRSDEGPTPETPALQIPHGGNPTFTNSLDKTKLLYRDFNIGGREQAKLDWTLECGIKESRLPKRFLIMDILMFGISAICK